jgi:hypothetical protein
MSNNNNKKENEMHDQRPSTRRVKPMNNRNRYQERG